jgi:hypothetical protein
MASSKALAQFPSDGVPRYPLETGNVVYNRISFPVRTDYSVSLGVVGQ